MSTTTNEPKHLFIAYGAGDILEFIDATSEDEAWSAFQEIHPDLRRASAPDLIDHGSAITHRLTAKHLQSLIERGCLSSERLAAGRA